MPNPLDGNYNLGSLNDLTSEELNTIGTPEAILVDDVNNLDLLSLSAKYGGINNASKLLDAVTQGTGQYVNDLNQSASPLQTASDFAVNVGTGAVSGIGSLASLGAGLVDPEAGLAVANATNDISSWMSENLLSEELQAQQRAVTAKQEASEAFNKAKYKDAPLKRFLADVGDQIVNGTFDTNTAIVANAIGSTATSIPMARGVRAVGNGILRALGSEGFAVGSSIPFTTANALMEGAGSYQGGVSAVMEMTTDQLMASPVFKSRYEQNLASGMSRSGALQKAKEDTAHAVGLKSAAVGVAVGAASGPMSAWLERPFGAVNTTRALSNTLGETFGEALEGATESIGQNAAIRSEANPNQDILEGVGAETAQGIIGGAGTSAPAVAVGYSKQLLSAAKKSTSDYLDKKEQQINENQVVDSEEASQTILDNISKIKTSVQSAPQQVQQPTENQQVQQTPQEEVSENPSTESITEEDNGLSSEVDNALNVLQEIGEASQQSGVTFTQYIGALYSGSLDNKQIPEDQLNNIENFLTFWNAKETILNTDIQNQEVKQSLEAISQVIEDNLRVDPKKYFNDLKTSLEEKIKSEDPNIKNRAVVAMAQVSPASLKNEDVKTVLKADAANPTLSESARTALQLADAYTADAEERMKKVQFGSDKTSSVYRNIVDTFWADSDKIPVTIYIKSIADALRAGNYEKALNDYHELRRFNTSRKKKYASLLKAKETKQRISYSALNPKTKEWYESHISYSNTARGNELAQQIELETLFTNSAVEAIDKVFPKLAAFYKAEKINEENNLVNSAELAKKLSSFDSQTQNQQQNTSTQKSQEVKEDISSKKEIPSKKEEVKQEESKKESSPVREKVKEVKVNNIFISDHFQVKEDSFKENAIDSFRAKKELVIVVKSADYFLNLFNKLFKNTSNKYSNALKFKDENGNINLRVGSRIALAAAASLKILANRTISITEFLADKGEVFPNNSYISGIFSQEATSIISRKMREYSGLSANSSTRPVDSDAIFDSLANTVIADLLQHGFLEKKTFNVENKSYTFFIPTKKLNESPLVKSNVSLEFDSIFDSEERIDYFNEDTPRYSKHILHTHLPISKAAKKMLDKLNKQDFFFYEPMMNLLDRLGSTGLINLFGRSIDKNIPWNIYIQTSTESRNSTLIRGYEKLRLDRELMQAYAKEKGIPLSEVRKHYKTDLITNNRIQMHEGENPLSNKIVREVMTPFVRTVDLTDPDIRNEYDRALAQAFGIKIANKSPEAVRAELESMLDRYKDTALYEDLQEENTKKLTGTEIKEAMLYMGIAEDDITPVALHALFDYANIKDPKNHVTTLYTESDGTTNGNFFLQIQNLSAITKAAVSNLARAGFYIGSRKTLSEGRADEDWTGGIDNYSYLGSVKGFGVVKDSWNANKIDLAARNAIIYLIAGEELSDDYELARSLVKNPVTVVGYGSGSKGLAEKFIHNFKLTYLELINRLAQGNKSVIPTLEKYNKAIKQLINSDITIPKNTEEAIKFELSPLIEKELVDTIDDLFTSSFLVGVREGLTRGVTNSILLTQNTSQIVSQLYSQVWRQILTNYLDKRVKEQGIPRNAGLSRDEIDTLRKENESIIPEIYTSYISLGLYKEEKDVLGRNTNFGSSLQIEVRKSSKGQDKVYPVIVSDNLMNLPTNLGVAWMANSTISLGDAQVIMRFVPTAPATLNVFDGVHASIGELNEVSQKLNYATVEAALNTNPVRIMANLVDKFIESKIPISSQVEVNLREFLNKFAKRNGDLYLPEKTIKETLKKLSKELHKQADAVDAVHTRLKLVGVTSDQYAGAEDPYSSKKLTSKTFYKALADISKVNVIPSTKPIKVIKQSVRDFMTARVASIPRDLLKTFININRWNDAQVVSGSREDLNQWLSYYGYEYQVEEGVDGLYLPKENLILVVGGNPRVMLHEFIHASTFKKIFDVYLTNDKKSDIAKSLKRIEQAMKQILDLPLSEVPEADRAQFSLIREKIQSLLKEGTPYAKAVALNEFMAYGLTHEVFSKVLDSQKTNRYWKSGLRRFINRVLSFIFGYRPSFETLKEYLQVNTQIIAYSQRDISTEMDKLFLRAENYNPMTKLQSSWISSIKRIASSRTLDQEEKFIDEDKRRTSAFNVAEEIVKASAAGYDLSNSTNRAVFTATGMHLKFASSIPSNQLGRAYQLLYLAGKKLTPEDFGSQDKYDYFFGTKTDKPTDLFARQFSCVLIDPKLQSALDRISLKSLKVESDGLVRQIATDISSSIANRLDKIDSSESVKKAFNQYLVNFTEEVNKENNVLSSVGDKGHNLVMAANQKIVSLIDSLGSSFKEKAENTSNKYLKALDNLAANLLDKNPENTKDYFYRFINKKFTEGIVSDLASDILGSTKDTYDIYSLQKQSKSFVQRARDMAVRGASSFAKKAFTKELSTKEKEAITNTFLATDIGSLLDDSYSEKDILSFINNRTKLKNDIKKRIEELSSQKNGSTAAKLCEELAEYMVNGTIPKFLHRNAESIALVIKANPEADLVRSIDTLVSLLAFDKSLEKNELSSLRDQEKGLSTVLRMARTLSSIEKGEAKGIAKYNYQKGYIPLRNKAGTSLVIAYNKDEPKFRQRGYVKVSDYKSALGDKYGSMGIYFSSVGSKAIFQQGAIQDIGQTAGGVDLVSGRSIHSSGTLDSPYFLRKYSESRKLEGAGMIPIFNENGKIIALEREVPKELRDKYLQPSKDVFDVLGIWSGRALEENLAKEFNLRVVDVLLNQEKNIATNEKDTMYIDIFSNKLSPVVQDAVRLLPQYVKDYIIEKNGTLSLKVRKDALKDVIGQRTASVTDFWTGNTRWSPETQRKVRRLAYAILGPKAYKYLKQVETGIFGLTSLARNFIVVRSVVVPAINLIGNIYSLLSRGIPIWTIGKSIAQKLPETERFMKYSLEAEKIRAELASLKPSDNKVKILNSRLKLIDQAVRKLSIYPLIEAGEFSTINDLGLTSEDLSLSNGNWGDYFEQKIDKLPDPFKIVAKYTFVTKDTPVYQALEKAVQYSDFIAKAIYYDHLTNELDYSSKEVLRVISEEFVNYDRLSGRTRGYLENIGVAWFWNYKLRILKVALSQLRRNPLQSLLALSLPQQIPVGNIGVPITDNFLTQAWERLEIPGVGTDQLLNSPFKLPMFALVS